MNMLKASITARQSAVECPQSRLRCSTITDKVVKIIHKRYEELAALHNIPTSAATPGASSSGALSNEKGLLSEDIFIYMTQVVDITGGKAIVDLENALHKIQSKDEAKDPQQGPAITKDTLADTVRKAVPDALRKGKGIFPLTSLKREVTDSSCVTFSNEGKWQKASQKGQEKAQLTF